ncbi:MAG: T9SS type A sorting domain-containing protein [Bacteroidota bacterium]
MRFRTTMLLIGLTAMVGRMVQAQGRFESQASGSWGTASTWTLAAGSDADGIPDATDTVIVQSPHAVSVGGSNVDCARLSVEAGSTVTIGGAGNVRINANPGSVSVYGTVTMSSSGTIQENGAGTRSFTLGSSGIVTISGTAAFPAFDSYALDPASTVEFTRSGDQTIRSGIVFGNLTLGGSGRKTVSPVPADTTFRSEGTLTIASGVTLDVSTNILHVFFDGDVMNSGTLDASVGIVVVVFSGSQFVNNGTFLTSSTPGYGYTPSVTYVNTTVSGSSPQTYYDLVVDGTMSPGGNLTVTRHLTIMAGGVLNAGTGLTHTVGGNWTNGGGFNCGTSTVQFQGSALQDIGASTFYNVVVNNAAGVRLTGNLDIAAGGTLTLTSGNLTTGANTLTMNGTDPASLVLGSNSITGTVARAIAPGSTGTYRFFSANAYIIPGGTGNPTSITATVFPNTNPPNLGAGADTNVIVKRYYRIDAVGMGPGFGYSIRLPYNQSEVRGNEYNYTLWENSGSGWVDVGVASAPDTAANFAEQNGLTALSDWTLAENTAALPIQLGSFQGAVVGTSADVRLTWTTVSEINNYGFYVQRSASAGGPFVTLPSSFVPGNGTTLSPQQYSWTDRSVAAGTHYYRLQQVDLDGSTSFSEAVKVIVATATGVEEQARPERFALAQNYPNPFNPATTIRFSVATTGHATLVVYNILGNELATLFAGTAQAGREYTVTFNGDGLANGAYFCRLTSGEKTELRKMILLK